MIRSGKFMLPSVARLFERLPRSLCRHRLMRWWMAFTVEDLLQLVRIRGDAFGYANLSDGFVRLIVIDGNFKSDFFRLADSFLGAGDVFLDAGANHGLLSLGLADRHGERVDFHLFEPNPKLVASVKKSLALYPGMQCTVNQATVADREGVVSFFFDKTQSGASHISDDAGHQVSCVTLDRYLEEAGIPSVQLLKMDVEGYELVALCGARRSVETQAIHFEYYDKCLSRVQPSRELPEFLWSPEYEVCFCRSGDLEPRGSATHTIRDGLRGHGVPLLAARGYRLPEMTDLLAMPRANLVRAVG